MGLKAAWKAFNRPELYYLGESIDHMLTLYDWTEVRRDRYGEYDVLGKTAERKYSDN